LGSKLDKNNFIRLNHNLLFEQNISFDLPLTRSRFKFTEKSEKSDLPQTVIGQGETLMTPLHNALIMCAIANDGIMMHPMLVDQITAADGVTVKKHNPRVLMELEEKEAIPALKTMLAGAVTDGTASYLQDEDYTAAGKTGTAENEKEEPHAWFVGYSNVEKPDLVVCVIVENTGSGSDYAVPIAKDVFDAYYDQEEE
jgi:peptidoglycan glycosyltransferase